MAHALAPLFRLALVAAPLVAVGYLGFALRERWPRPWHTGRALPVAAVAGLGLVPATALGGPTLLAAGLLLGAAAALSLLAWRTLARCRVAERTARETVARALEGLESGPEAQRVTVCGRLEGEPAAHGPLSRRPCLRFRLEVSREQGHAGAEPVFLDEGGADRLVLRDPGGRLVLGSEVRLPRGGLEPFVVEGEVGAEEWHERPAPRRRIARLAREYDPDPPAEGAPRYRFVERILPDGLEVRVIGRVERRGGEPVLESLLLSPSPREAPSARTLRWDAARHAAAAAAAAGAGWLWLSGL